DERQDVHRRRPEVARRLLAEEDSVLVEEIGEVVIPDRVDAEVELPRARERIDDEIRAIGDPTSLAALPFGAGRIELRRLRRVLRDLHVAAVVLVAELDRLHMALLDVPEKLVVVRLLDRGLEGV